MPNAPKADPIVQIYIDKNGNVAVNQSSVRVSVNARNSVIWYSEDGDAKIEFNKDARGAPFRSDVFICPRGGFVGSGPPIKGNPKDDAYSYRVTVTPPGQPALPSLDPDVIVENGP